MMRRMRRALLLVVAVILVGWTSTAGADIRPDKPRPQNAPEPSPPPDSSPVPTNQPRVEPQGCAGREMAPEWLFGLGVLALGVTGMRRYRTRGAAAA
jgi:hypothetical protein